MAGSVGRATPALQAAAAAAAGVKVYTRLGEYSGCDTRPRHAQAGLIVAKVALSLVSPRCVVDEIHVLQHKCNVSRCGMEPPFNKDPDKSLAPWLRRSEAPRAANLVLFPGKGLSWSPPWRSQGFVRRLLISVRAHFGGRFSSPLHVRPSTQRGLTAPCDSLRSCPCVVAGLQRVAIAWLNSPRVVN